jgi:hypothetical protein
MGKSFRSKTIDLSTQSNSCETAHETRECPLSTTQINSYKGEYAEVSLATLNGISVVRSQALAVSATTGLVAPDAKVGLYTFNGMGGVTLSADENSSGTTNKLALSGDYTVAPNGRVSATLSSGLGGCINCIAAVQATTISPARIRASSWTSRPQPRLAALSRKPPRPS